MPGNETSTTSTTPASVRPSSWLSSAREVGPTCTTTYGQYRTFLSRLGAEPYSHPIFQRKAEGIAAAVRKVLDEQCEAAKHYIKNLHGPCKKGETRVTWKRMFAAADCSWCTPADNNAPHGMFCVRIPTLHGALLDYELMSRNSKENPFLATSTAMECHGGFMCFTRLEEEGCGSESFKMVLDGDTALQTCFLIISKNGVIRFCCSHRNKNCGKNTKLAGVGKGKHCCCQGKNHKWTVTGTGTCGCIQGPQELAFMKKCNNELLAEGGEKKDPRVVRHLKSGRTHTHPCHTTTPGVLLALPP
jgi:hypothetical protein